MTDILKGLRVVEGSAFVAVPLAGMTLAQMGAEVIRFDRLEGGLDHHRWPVSKSGRSHFWAGLNKGKRSFAVDMRSAEARELISELICAPGPDSGILLTNLRVRGWLDYETLSRRRADLIMVSIIGDRRGRPAVDYTVNPAVGIPDLTGPEGTAEPVASVLPAWDCICGQMAALGVLGAERRRTRTGEGEHVEIGLKDVACAVLGHLGLIGEASELTEDRPKAGNALYGAYGQDFVCADGRRVMVIGLTGRQWKNLVAVTDSAEAMAAVAAASGLDLAQEGNRYRARHAITAALAPWFAARRVEEFAEAFDKAGVTWSEFRSLRRALAEDEDFSDANPLFTTLAQEGLGAYPVPGLPLRFHNAGRTPPKPAPALGGDTEAILSEILKLPDHAVDDLFARGVVGGPRR
jgi:2-methylfumaryl-CoA isomerase